MTPSTCPCCRQPVNPPAAKLTAERWVTNCGKCNASIEGPTREITCGSCGTVNRIG